MWLGLKSIIVIPARLESTRLPRKLLMRETGKSLLQHTYEAASTSKRADQVTVAVDHPELAAEVTRFGGNVVMTDTCHCCGTDRVAEVANGLGQFEIFVNVQGDEPELPGTAIDLAISILETNPDAKMATLATPLREEALLRDPSCVKIVLNDDNRALYFSRAPIPFARNWDENLLSADAPNFYQHVGLYAYRREFLLQIPNMNRPAIESIE